jgi:Protein of unknown function (DUF4235)
MRRRRCPDVQAVQRVGCTQMKILYKPVAIIASLISARIGRNVFRGLWSKIDDQRPPGPTTGEGTLPKVVGAAVLEAATMAAVSSAVSRASATVFHYLTGAWPGEKKEAESEEDSDSD